MDKEKKKTEAAEEEKVLNEEEIPETEAKADAKEEEKKEKKLGKKAKKEEAKEPTPEKSEEKAPEKPAEKAPAKPTPEQEIAAANDKYLRVLAEYDNFRKRSQKEKESLYGDIKANAVKEFLPVYDNLERALAAETADEAYRKGVEMIMTQFMKTLEKLGVTEIKSLGEKFDPELHNAVMHVDDEEKGENEIVDVFQKGFMLGEKVIRFAMVKVAN